MAPCTVDFASPVRTAISCKLIAKYALLLRSDATNKYR